MPRVFNILLVTYLSIWIFYFTLNLFFNSMTLSPEFESDVSKISLRYNYVYQSESSAFQNSLLLGGALIGFLSIVGMFFRLKYSNFVFVGSVLVMYFYGFFEKDTFELLTKNDYIFEYTLFLLEGAILSLILFNKDIGFPKIGR